MMKKLIFLVFTVTAANAFANDFFAKADVNAGKALVEKNCISCHASSYGGDGSEIYTRAFHKVESSKALLAQVRACNTNLNLKWFEEDELNASAYLNKAYYKFEQ
jgi:cytochrome c553